MNRVPWDEYFMQQAYHVATRSTCTRRKVGAVVTRQKRVVATGYNGAPSGLKHCSELGGCMRELQNIKSGTMHEVCRAVHAEQNIVAQAARFGIVLEGTTIYVTCSPCIICTKLIIQAGISRVVSHEHYPDEVSLDMLREAEIIYDTLEDFKHEE